MTNRQMQQNLGKAKFALLSNGGQPICYYRAYIFGKLPGSHINLAITCGAPKHESISIDWRTGKVLTKHSRLHQRTLSLISN